MPTNSELTPELKGSYERVVKDLEEKRSVIHAELTVRQKRLRDLNERIAGLYREMGSPVPPTVATVGERKIVTLQPDQKYSMISVHWAILHLLSEAKQPMTTAEIADALTAAGVKTKAANFVNNVSAMMSTTLRTRGEEEVEAKDGRWQLTDVGRNKTAFIVASSKFRRACPWIVESQAGAA
jgi:hypothetical protein